MNHVTSLCPLLVVRGAARAIDFYQTALGARLLACREHGAQGHISHADLALEGARFALTEELRGWNSDAPASLGGSPVVLQLAVRDVAATLAALCAAGASVVFPLQTFAGERMARVRDPFGHLWLLRELAEPPAVEGPQLRRDELLSAPTQEGPTIESARLPGQAANAAASFAPRAAGVHLVLGPVGAGKSTFARALVQERSALLLALDDWMTTLFSRDRPETGLPAWYSVRAERCIEQIWKLVRQLTARGDEVVLELGLLRREERERFYARVAEAELPLTVYVLDAARDVRRERVRERNHNRGATFSMVVPPDIFELASDLWQPPEREECEHRDVRFLRTD